MKRMLVSGIFKQLRTFVVIPDVLSKFSKIENLFFFRGSVRCHVTVRFSRIKFDFAGTYKTGNLLGRDHSANESGNSSRFPGTRRSTSSELVRTSRRRQRLGSAIDFYS